MNHLAITALLPVVILILIGFFSGRAGLVGSGATKDFSNLLFWILTPALLFKTMSTVHVEELNFKPVAMYFIAAAVLFLGYIFSKGLSRRSVVLALASVFSNTVAIGIPLVSLAYGQEGVVILLTLVSFHSLVMLTTATLVLELAITKEGSSGRPPSFGKHLITLFRTLRNGIIHPVPISIICGLLFAQTSWMLPSFLEQSLSWLANGFGPIALLLVGISLAHVKVGSYFKSAVALSLVKNLIMPAVVGFLSWAMGLEGIPLKVMIVAACVPVGANVFVFSQRYEVAQGLITATMAVSNVLALVTVSIVMALLALF